MAERLVLWVIVYDIGMTLHGVLIGLIRRGGRAVKTSDSSPVAMGSIPDQVRSSWYASGQCMQYLLPLPTQECTRTIGYLVFESVCHKTVIVSANCIIGCLPVKQVYTYIKDQGNNGL